VAEGPDTSIVARFVMYDMGHLLALPGYLQPDLLFGGDADL